MAVKIHYIHKLGAEKEGKVGLSGRVVGTSCQVANSNCLYIRSHHSLLMLLGGKGKREREAGREFKIIRSYCLRTTITS